MNWLTTRKHLDSLLRLTTDEAEATFAVQTHAPGRLEIELGALLASLRPAGAPRGSGALKLTTLAERDPAEAPARPLARRFCGKCGGAALADDAFCRSCGVQL